MQTKLRFKKFPISMGILAGMLVIGFLIKDLIAAGEPVSSFQAIMIFMVFAMFVIMGLALGVETIPLLHRQVQNPPDDPSKLSFKNYWLNGKTQMFYVEKCPFTGVLAFRVTGVSKGPDDTLNLSEEEVARYVSTKKEAVE